MPLTTEYPMNRDELVLLFKSEVSDQAEEVDPEDQLDWQAIMIGWALAKGLPPDDAQAFARFI